MKAKQELLKLYSAYHPYKLDILTELDNVTELFNIDNNQNYICLETLHGCHDASKVKPILYSMDFLTKEIEHDGEKFIPIEKLFDIETGLNWSASDYIKSVKGKDEFWVRKNDDGRSFSFGYNSENKYFYYIDADGFNTSVKKQYELFQKLFQWHFNVFNLDDSEYVKK